MGSDEPKRKRPRPAPPADDGGGGLYDFLPPPDPKKDEAAKLEAEKNLFSRPKLPPEDRTRVIFLDVDGVLLPAGSIETINVDGVDMPVRDTVRESDFAISALGSLRSIVQQTGASIVLSSEWRRTDKLRSSIGAVLRSQDMPQLRDWTQILQARKDVGEISPVFAWCERRAREIGLWLKDHPEVTSWVALDDLDFSWADSYRMAGTPWCKIRSVHTHCVKCLDDEGATEAVRILLNPPPEPKVPRRQQSNSSGSKPGGLLASTEDSMPDRIRLG